MKKLTVILLSFFLLFSCNQTDLFEEDIFAQNENSSFDKNAQSEEIFQVSTTKLDNESLKSSFNLELTPELRDFLGGFDGVSQDFFNFDDIKVVSNNYSETQALMVNDISYSESNTTSYTFSMIIDNDGTLITPIITKISKIGNTSYIDYYYVNSNERIKLAFADNLLISKEVLTNHKKDKGCIQKIADCVGSAYVEQGLASLAIFVTTAFYPATVVAVVAVCATGPACK